MDELKQLLALANKFRDECPRILLGKDGTFFLDMEIIGNLTLLSKLQINPNDATQYQNIVGIVKNVDTHIEKLNIHLNKTGADHPTEYNELTHAAYYTHLETIKQRIIVYPENTFPHLHSSRQLITALEELKKFDPKEHGALHQLLMTLENTFNQTNVPAAEKLIKMMQQISDAHDAVKKTIFTPLKLFGAKPKPNPLVPAFESFINNDMAAIAKSNGITPFSITGDHAPTLRSRNTSTNP